MNAVLERFTSEYEETIHKEAGEFRKVLEDKQDKRVANIRKQIKDLILDYVNGNVDDDNFQERRDVILVELGKIYPEFADRGALYIDNLKEIAENIKTNLEHNAGIRNLDLDFEIIIGRAKTGVRTEANFNVIDRLTKKIVETPVGKFVNEATVASAVAIVYSLMTRATTTAVKTGARLSGLGLFGATAITGGLVAGVRESKILEEERRQHFREMAQGGTFETRAPRRAELEKYRYETRTASELRKNLFDALYQTTEKGEIQLREFSSTEEFRRAIQALVEIEARIGLSDSLRVDLISFSSPTTIEQERLDLDILRAKAKIELRKLADKMKQLGILQDNQTFDSYLETLIRVRIDDLTTSEIEAKNRLFRKMERRRVAEAVVKGSIIGTVFGLIVQEGWSLLSAERVGLLESVFGKVQPKAGEHLTVLESFRRWLLGDWPKAMPDPNNVIEIGNHAVVLPQGAHLVLQKDGSYSLIREGNVLMEGIRFHSDGSLTNEAMESLKNAGIDVEQEVRSIGVTKPTEITPKEFIQLQQREGIFTKVRRVLWYDNDTRTYRGPDGRTWGADLNELKLWWGGENNLGIDADGNFVLTIKEMTPEGSFHKGFSANPQQLLLEGKLRLLISLSQDTQANVIELPINENGEVVIPKDSKIAKMLFGVEGGKAKFLGRFMEVAKIAGEQNGTKEVEILATYVGDGLKSITVDVPSVEQTYISYWDLPEDFRIDLPPVIPFYPRTPLEPISQKPPELTYLYNLYGYHNENIWEEHRKRFHPKLLDNPEIDLSGDDTELIDDYFDRQEKGYLEDLKNLEDQITGQKVENIALDTKTEAVIAIPAYHEANNLEIALQQYAKLENPEKVEIVIFENHPKDKKEIKPKT